MRIVSGQWRSRRLKTPEGAEIRPTSDIVKQALFNIIAPKVRNAQVLDLFAGTGQIGLEALSNGAKRVVFADKSKQSLKLIQENINLLKAQEQCEIMAMDYADAMARLHSRKEQFDLIIADPPYAGGYYENIMSRVVSENLLTPEGLLVLEYDAKDEYTPAEGLLTVSKRKYGRRSLLILALKGDGAKNESGISGQL